MKSSTSRGQKSGRFIGTIRSISQATLLIAGTLLRINSSGLALTRLYHRNRFFLCLLKYSKVNKLPT